MFFNLDCLLGSMPTLLSLSTVTDGDLGSLVAYLDGSEAKPANSSQRLLFRVVDDMRGKEAKPADYAEVRDLIAARLAGEVICEVVEYDDEPEYEDFIYDDAA